MPEMIILVDKNDNEIGFMEKMAAHENGGTLHRAFSIFIFNSKGEMLLQLRAKKKYHFGNLWTNTCCSHPNKGESLENAVHRKLNQEFGFDCDLKEIFSFIYKADFTNGLAEHELDHVFVGRFDNQPQPNPDEIDDYKWIDPLELQKDVENNPDNYTPWFKICLNRVLEHMVKKIRFKYT
ncbi:MAG: isopentenyl-diphosphate Delta-isomerase [Candidatus Aenigmatarchaeota archaeon]